MKKTLLILFALLMSASFSFAADLSNPDLLSQGFDSFKGGANYDAATQTLTFSGGWSGAAWNFWGQGDLLAGEYDICTIQIEPVNFWVQVSTADWDHGGPPVGPMSFDPTGKVVIPLKPATEISIESGQDGGQIKIISATLSKTVSVTPSSVIDFESNKVGDVYPYISWSLPGEPPHVSAIVQPDPAGGSNGNSLEVAVTPEIGWSPYPKFQVSLADALTLSDVKKIAFDIYFINNGNDSWTTIDYAFGESGMLTWESATMISTPKFINAPTPEPTGTWLHKEFPVSQSGGANFDFAMGLNVPGADYYLDNITFSKNPNIAVTGVGLDVTSAAMYVGDTWQLTALVYPSFATDRYVSFTSSDETVARVGSTGFITAVGGGTATITVEAAGGFTATCDVTVSVHATSVNLDKALLDMVVGNTGQLIATVSPDNATDQTVTWSSSDPTVATVSNTGLVTAVAAGTATITVKTTDGSFSAVCEVNVTPAVIPVTGVTLNKTTATLATDSTLQLTATVAPANATNKVVTWSSSDESVATVSNTGLVTAVAAGTATITVSTEDVTISATCTVEVSQKTDIPALNAGTSAYITGDQLVVQSPVAETVQIYSVSGVLLDTFQKQAGKISYPINESKGTVLIVKGSSGWVKKLIK